MLCVLAASLQLWGVVRSRELVFLSSTVEWIMNSEEQLENVKYAQQPWVESYLRSKMGWLKHDRGVAEFLNETVSTLDGWKTISANTKYSTDVDTYWHKISRQPYHSWSGAFTTGQYRCSDLSKDGRILPLLVAASKNKLLNVSGRSEQTSKKIYIDDVQRLQQSVRANQKGFEKLTSVKLMNA